MPQQTILCAAYGGGHVKACLPVALALNDAGWDVHFLALTTAYDPVIASGAAGAGVTVWQARDLLGPKDADILALGQKLCADAPSGGPVSPEESAAYHGLGYHDLRSAHGSQKAALIYADRGRLAFEHGVLAARILDAVSPDLVMASNSPRGEKAVIDAAQSRGIPAAVLNDTLASPNNHWLHNPDYADRFFVLSEPVRQALIDSGHAPEKIVITGNPALEPMARLRDMRLQQKSWPAAARRVLYVSQPLVKRDAGHQDEVVAALHRIAAARDDWEVRVRLHPNEEQQPEWLKPPFRCDHGAALEEDLLHADAVLTHGSTVGIEAALAGIPVVLQMGSYTARECRFPEFGIAEPAQTIADLEPAIDRALAKAASPAAPSTFTMPPGALGNVVAALDAMAAEAVHA